MSNWDGMDSLVTGGLEKDARNKSKRAIDQWSNLDIPDFKDYNPTKYKYLEDFTAEKAQAGDDVNYDGVDARLADTELAGRSEMDGVSVDPRLEDAQMDSLSALQDLAASGGMTAADKAQLNQIQSEVGQADRGRRDAIKQGMAQRGMGGSGMELLQMLDSSQAATDRANQSGLDIAGMAQQRALDAMLQSGNMAGSIRGQDFGEQAKVAEANDIINKFNTSNVNQGNQYNTNAQNQMAQFNAGNALQNAQYNRDTNLGANQFNANAANQAGMYNNTNRQTTANANTDLRNQAKMQNQFVAPQQQFENQVTQAAGKSGAYNDLAGLTDKQAGRRVDGVMEGSQMAMKGFGASDERVKKDIKHIDPEELSEFLKAVQPKKFKYRNPDQPGQKDGERVGFLMQDVEHTKLGKAMARTGEDGTKGYDKDNLDGILLAALSSLAKGA